VTDVLDRVSPGNLGRGLAEDRIGVLHAVFEAVS
jgi:hypothetical protein